MKLLTGKVPKKILEKIILKYLGSKRKEVILGPALGEDGAVIKVGGKLIVSSVDPITGAIEQIGWLAVNICANDVATFGVKPAFFSSCILLPRNADEKILETICKQIDLATKKLEMAVIGGHSEITPDLTSPVVIGHCMGIAEKNRYVTSSGAKAGDHLILTKSAGIEGTAILATDKYEVLKNHLNEKLLASAQRFFEKISVVEEALLAFKYKGVKAMHDPTEGGVAGGIHEMADASEVGVEIFEEKIPVARETLEICKFFKIDPLQLISSGTLLIATKPSQSQEIVEKLKANGIQARVIGKFVRNKEERKLIKKDGKIKKLVRPKFDHLWKALQK
jgi:hydrogenase maturation factor